MTTLATMKARIVRELRRSDLTTEIAESISDAITYYQGERWLFNETREHTFNTVASQEHYTSSDLAALALVVKFDWIKLYIGNQPFTLIRESDECLESWSTNGTALGQPGWWSWYNSKLRFYPVPAEAWTVRISGVFKYAEPASDAEANNPWMLGLHERLIRSHAKREIAISRTYNEGMAAAMNAVVEQTLAELRRNRSRQKSTGIIQAWG